MKKRVVVIILILALMVVAWGIHVNLRDKAAIGIIGGADGPTAIFISKDADVDFDEMKEENVEKEWTTQEIAELFKMKADPEYTFVTCAGMFDFAYDRVGVILYTDSKEGRENKLYRKNPRKTGSVYSIGR